MARWTTLLLLALAVGFSPLSARHAAAAEETPASMDALTEALKQQYSAVKALSADITQVSRTAMGETTMTGTMAVSQPGKARWSLAGGGFETLMVFDGSVGWVYTPASKQVIKMDNAGGQAVDPLQLLQTLHEQFDAALSTASPAGLIVVEAKPKAESPLAGQFQSMTLELQSANHDPARLVLIDVMGNTTEIRFAKVQRDPTLDESLFEFTPPAGVAVVDGSL